VVAAQTPQGYRLHGSAIAQPREVHLLQDVRLELSLSTTVDEKEETSFAPDQGRYVQLSVVQGSLLREQCHGVSAAPDVSTYPAILHEEQSPADSIVLPSTT